MPVEECQFDGKPGYRYGATGKCYTYNPDSTASKERAHKKAEAQGRAIEASKHSDSSCSTNPKLHIDKINFVGKILYQDDKITVVPCVLMAEGVQNRALKPFEEFYDPEGLEGALWFEGVPITREHPPGHVTHLTPKIGRIRNVQPDVDNRRITAEAVLFNDRLTPDEMKKIEAGDMLGGSIGFWCNDELLDEPQIWADTGEEYSVIQKAPFFGDHFALVQDPACPVGVCGFNIESRSQSHDDCKCKKQLEVNKLPDETKAAAGEQPVTEEKEPPAGDPKPPEVDAKTPEARPQETTVDNSNPSQSVVMQMDSKLLERFNALEAKIDSQAREIASLKEDKVAREAAMKVEQDKKISEGLKANFDQAYQLDWDKYWPEIQKNGINAFLANPEHAKHWDVKGEKRQIVPIGATFVQHNSDSDEAEFDALGVPKEDDLAKKLGGRRA